MAMRGLADRIVMAFVRLNPARLYRMRPRLPSPARFAWFDCLLRFRQTGRVPGKRRQGRRSLNDFVCDMLRRSTRRSDADVPEERLSVHGVPAKRNLLLSLEKRI